MSQKLLTRTTHYVGQGYIYRCPECDKPDRMPYYRCPTSGKCRFCNHMMYFQEDLMHVASPPDPYYNGIMRDIGRLERGY